jgi:hypothetical protein
MGDKSPKANLKKKKQNQTKTATVAAIKREEVLSKQVPGKKG